MPAAPTTTSARRLIALATLVLVVGVLWVAQTVLMPLALGMVLAFVLTPLVRMFERLRFPRALAVASTIVITLAGVGALGWVAARQVGELALEAPGYVTAIHDKLEAAHPTSGTLERLSHTVDRLGAELDEAGGEREYAPPVRVLPGRFSAFDGLRETVELVLAPLATGVMVLVLVSFMLGRREDVRDRVIRLVGADNLTFTTRLIDETFHGVSRYLFTQSLLNAMVGLLTGVALWLLDVPYAALFGAAMALLRFVPYVGSLVAMALGTIVAFATSPGWSEAVLALGIVLVLDLAFAYFVEPLVMARRVGVSSLALLVFAVFWTWLWGPMGLALATPLTLCLAALGRHVPGLEFLDVVLGDTRALPDDVRYYQRLLARDADDAREILVKSRAELGDERMVDELVVPALLAAVRDQDACTISDEDAAFANETTAKLLDELAVPEAGAPAPSSVAPFTVIAVGPGGEALEAMLRLTSGGAAQPLSGELLLAEIVQELEQAAPRLVCIAALSNAATTAARRLCRRIRTRLPELGVLIFCPTDEIGFESRTRESGAGAVVTRIADAMVVVAQPHWSSLPRTSAATTKVTAAAS